MEVARAVVGGGVDLEAPVERLQEVHEVVRGVRVGHPAATM